MEYQNTTSRSTDPIKNEKDKIIEIDQYDAKDDEIIKLLKNLNPDSPDLLDLVNDLIQFIYEFKSLKNIEKFLTRKNLIILKKLGAKENIKIRKLLSNIYMEIINNNSLYSQFLITLQDDEENANIIMQFIDECISLIENLNGFVFDQEIFDFKTKTYSLVKCIYLNCRNSLKNEAQKSKLQELIDNLPAKLFSETYNELNKDKDLSEIGKSKDPEKISNFEDKFAQINSYYEQFEAFKKFVELNSEVATYGSVGGSGNIIIEEEAKKEILDPNKIDFYQQYGMLLLKFCKYHQYIFLNKESTSENKEKKEGDDENDNIRVVFLLDKIKQEEEENKKEVKQEEGNKKIENIMNEKLFVSVTESKEYNDLIKKLINYFINFTKAVENEPKIKTILEQMKYYLGILEVESYVPLYLTDFSKITISDNFTPSFLTNVPAGKSNEFYLETKMEETMLLFIEFSLEDKSKDITFEVNKYEIGTNSYKSIFKEEKIEDTFKFFILVNGYSLYQIIFNNYYSWFTSKDVNYRIALLKLIDKPKKNLGAEEKVEEKEEKKEEIKVEEKEEIKIEEKEETKEIKEEKKEENKEEKKDEKKDEKKEEIVEEEKIKIEEEKPNQFYCKINGNNNSFEFEKISQKIKECCENKNNDIINIPVILYLNTLRIISIKKTENEKDEIKFIEKTEEDENFISQSFFNYEIASYLKKNLKLKPNQTKDKIINLLIFSQNRDLPSLFEDLKEQIKNPDEEDKNVEGYDNYLKKIGFCPKEAVEGYKVQFKLYDLCEQSLIYHLYLSSTNKEIPKNPVLFLEFDKLVTNAAIFNEGEICNDLEKNKIKSGDFSNIKNVIELIDNANDTFKGIEVTLSCVDNFENKELIENIKKHCKDNLGPEIKVVVYEQNEIADNVFSYINLFYNN